MARSKPGELHDKNGVPIYPGDLLRSFHFTERRYRRKHYLYHTVVWSEEHQTVMNPTSKDGGLNLY